MHLRIFLGVLLASSSLMVAHAAHAVPMPPKPELMAASLVPVVQSDHQQWDALALSPDGRLILQAPHWLGNPGPQLSIRNSDGSLSPYPNAAWNADSGDAKTRFIGITGLTTTSDGVLWVVDSGAPDRKHAAAAQAKLVRIDMHSGEATTLPIAAAALQPGSIPSGIAVHGDIAYVLDSGVAGLLVINTKTGTARRFLDHDPTVTARKPIALPDGVLRSTDGRPEAIDASLIAVSPDGVWLYFQPFCGPLYRMDTSLFFDKDSTDAALQEGVTLWYKTPALGGLIAGPDGTLYWSDISTGSIDSYTTGRIPHHLITDPKLRWPGGAALGANGTLYVPATQLDQAPAFHEGTPGTASPMVVYKLALPADATVDVLAK